MKRFNNILCVCIIALNGIEGLLCQIIPYQYIVSSESNVKEFSKYDKNMSMTIIESLTNHIASVEKSLLDNHESRTAAHLKLLSTKDDSLNLTYFLQDIMQLKLDLRDSIALLLPLKLQVEELKFLTESGALLPVKNSQQAKLFFAMDGSGSDVSMMSHSFFSYNTQSEKLALYSELFSDYFGPFRFGFGALVTSGQSSSESAETMPPSTLTDQDALQRLLNGGGNSVLSLAYPLIQLKDATWSKGIRLILVPKYALDIPALGSSVETYAANADLGMEANAHWTGHNQNIALFFQTRIGYVMGNNAFKESIGSDNNFMISQINFGIAFRNTIKLSYNIHSISNDEIDSDLDGFISFSLIPQL